MQNMQFQQQVQQSVMQSRQVKLQMFWHAQMLEIEGIDPESNDFRSHPLPLARIKKIMKTDEAVKMISAETPILFAKACELFITDMTKRAWHSAEDNKRRTLQKNDISACMSSTDEYDFLVDIVPRPDPVFPNGEKNTSAQATGGLSREQLQLIMQQQLLQAGGASGSGAGSGSNASSASGSNGAPQSNAAGGIPDLTQFGFPGLGIDALGQIVPSSAASGGSSGNATDTSGIDPAVVQMYENMLLQQQRGSGGGGGSDSGSSADSSAATGTGASISEMQQLLLQQQLLSQNMLALQQQQLQQRPKAKDQDQQMLQMQAAFLAAMSQPQPAAGGANGQADAQQLQALAMMGMQPGLGLGGFDPGMLLGLGQGAVPSAGARGRGAARRKPGTGTTESGKKGGKKGPKGQKGKSVVNV